MTSWEHHHPPQDHPDFDAYSGTLTEDDLAAITATTTVAATFTTRHGELDDRNDSPNF